MLLMLDWEAEAEKARALVAALQEAEDEEEVEEEGGGDTFSEGAPARQGAQRDPAQASIASASPAGRALSGGLLGVAGVPQQPRLERRRSGRSDSIPIQRSNSSQLLSVGSLTGSYARPKNSHL